MCSDIMPSHARDQVASELDCDSELGVDEIRPRRKRAVRTTHPGRSSVATRSARAKPGCRVTPGRFAAEAGVERRTSGLNGTPRISGALRASQTGGSRRASAAHTASSSTSSSATGSPTGGTVSGARPDSASINASSAAPQVGEVAERQQVESRAVKTALTHDRPSTADRGMRGVTAHGRSWRPQCGADHRTGTRCRTQVWRTTLPVIGMATAQDNLRRAAGQPADGSRPLRGTRSRPVGQAVRPME